MEEELVLLENPYYNPPRRRRRRRNLVSKNPTQAITKEWFQGVDMMDAGAALGGLAASTMLPGMLVKDATTNTEKLLKLTASLGSTAAAGFIFRNISASAGKMAIAGGLAGTLTQALSMFTNIQIGNPRQQISAPRYIAQNRPTSHPSGRMSGIGVPMPASGADSGIIVSTT